MKKSPSPVRHLELRVRELGQLFNSMDPTPFLNNDLDREVRLVAAGPATPGLQDLETCTCSCDARRVTATAITCGARRVVLLSSDLPPVICPSQSALSNEATMENAPNSAF